MGSVQKIAVSRSRISRSRVNGMEKDFIPGTVIVHEGYYLAGSDGVYVAGNDGTYLAGKDNVINISKTQNELIENGNVQE